MNSMKLFNVFPQKSKRFVGVQTASPHHAMYTHQSRDKSVRKYLFLRALCGHHARSESILTKEKKIILAKKKKKIMFANDKYSVQLTFRSLF